MVSYTLFSAERIISCQGTHENSGISLTKRDFRLQKGIFAYKTGISFTKWDSWSTNGTLGLLFTFEIVMASPFYLIIS